jgi:hypothetical protein
LADRYQDKNIRNKTRPHPDVSSLKKAYLYRKTLQVMDKEKVDMYYRFTSDDEPSDEQLAAIMEEVGEDVRRERGNFGSPANPCVFIALFKGFTYTASTFHQAPETRSRSGIAGETSSFHPWNFPSTYSLAFGIRRHWG